MFNSIKHECYHADHSIFSGEIATFQGLSVFLHFLSPAPLFWCGSFLKSTEFVTILLLFMFWVFCLFVCLFSHEACEISASQPGMESSLPPLEDTVFTTGLAGKSLIFLFLPNSLHHLHFSPSSPALLPTRTHTGTDTQKHLHFPLWGFTFPFCITVMAVEPQSFHLSEATYTILLPVQFAAINFFASWLPWQMLLPTY